MGGTVAIIANDTGRYTLFSVSITQLRHPVNTNVDWGLSTDIAGARNTLVERSLEVGSEWVYFIDDDHIIPPDGLLKLIDHDKDIVGSLYLRRAQPFAPVAFSHLGSNGLYQSLNLDDYPDGGLITVHAVGAAGLLVRSEVFRAIEQPWFEHGKVLDKEGKLKWDASEDIIFCEKAREAGFDIYLDLNTKLGHMAPCAIWPSQSGKKWIVGFTVSDGLRLYAEFPEK